MTLPQVDWTPPDIGLVQTILRSKVIALDTETKDPNLKEKGPGCWRKDGHIIGVSLAALNGPSVYLPFLHEGGDNLIHSEVLAALDDLRRYTGTVVGANLLYDLAWMREGLGLRLPDAKFEDVQWNEALLDETRVSYSLASCASYNGVAGKDEELLKAAAAAMGVDPKSELWKLPARYVSPYAEADAVATLAVWERQQSRIAEQNLRGVVDLENGNLPLLLEMRCRGVRVDLKRADDLLRVFQEAEKHHLEEIRAASGMDVEIWASASVAKLFDKVGIEFPRTALGAPSFTAPWLEGHEHPITKALLAARQANKAWSMAIEGMILNHEVGGRIHGELHPLRSEDGQRGTIGGRFSQSNPNLQQVPARNEAIGPAIRSCYLPEEDQQWASLDYSQQEPRVTIHYAEMIKAEGADRAGQQFRENPGTDYHQMVAEFAGLDRKQAKTINLGMAYGMGGAKLCKQLDLPTEFVDIRGTMVEVAGPEGKAIIKQYHDRLPYIKKLSAVCQRRAQDNGYIVTLGGRRCRFDMWESSARRGEFPLPRQEAVEKYGYAIKRAYTHKALNRLIQGSSADMIKFAMRDLWREGVVPLVTVHDELGLSVSGRREAERAAEIMQDCVKLTVPLKVDVEIGPTWGEAK